MDKRSWDWKWKRVLDGVAESVVEAPEDSLADWLREEGADIEAAAERVRSVLQSADKQFRQAELRRAADRYRRTVARLNRARYELPKSVDAQRAWLFSLLRQHPSLSNGLTLQHREFHEITDAEVEGYLKQLIELGVIDGLADDEAERS